MDPTLLEINDFELRWSSKDGFRREPGWALATEPVLLGSQALAQARLQPRFIKSQFWQQLSTDGAATSTTQSSACRNSTPTRTVRATREALRRPLRPRRVQHAAAQLRGACADVRDADRLRGVSSATVRCTRVPPLLE